MEDVRKGIQGDRLYRDDRSWFPHMRSLMCLSVNSMNLKEQCEEQQQNHFQDVPLTLKAAWEKILCL